MSKSVIGLLFAVFLFSANLFSQGRKCLKNDAFAKYNVLQFLDQKVVDSETTVTTLMIFENGLKKLILTRTDFDPERNTIITTRLNVRHTEVFRNMHVPYVKLNGELCRLRPEKNGANYDYFLDHLNPAENDFTSAASPFFSGSKEEGYSAVCDLYTTDSHYVLAVYNSAAGVTRFSVNTFDKQFQLISRNNTELPKANKVTYRGFHATVSKDDLFLYYNCYNPASKSCEIRIARSNGGEHKEMAVAGKPEDVHKNYVLYAHDGQLFLYLLKATKDSDSDWNAVVFLIEPDNGIATETHSLTLPLKTILEANKSNNLMKYQHSASYNLFDFYVDSSNNVYLFSFGCNYEQSLVFDCVVTKIASDGVAWNQYIRTDMLFNGQYGNCYMPALPFRIEENEDKEIVMHYWMQDKKMVIGKTTKGNYVIKKITLEQETGAYVNRIGYD
jgi:hypothetical protein